ncbi:MAG: adenylyltransferase/cytidyltransferase family protein [Candidatus Pacebacteria bacterium]|nr:adenylyltransferase/cytidyltransferase family protein [Candidatus Paceibacterota bacterium]MCF7862603.1 adenylyltransferase/cytidyltransferase family protein [Candidatus Paceibacterota bacterium]
MLEDKFFTDINDLQDKLKKESGKIISLTTGCFDVLHNGHKEYLKDAKSRGDILIVLLQSDELVGQRKGTKEKPRPIYIAIDRASQLFNAKEYKGIIDYILVVKSVTDIYESIEKINPNVLVLSESTEDDETSPKRMKEYFETYFADKIVVNILPPKSQIHSSDIIEQKGIKPNWRGNIKLK